MDEINAKSHEIGGRLYQATEETVKAKEEKVTVEDVVDG